jgi:hypothetical protein
MDCHAPAALAMTRIHMVNPLFVLIPDFCPEHELPHPLIVKKGWPFALLVSLVALSFWLTFF